MHPAEPGKAIFGFAECYRVTPAVIFTRGIAYQDDRSEPIAHVVGTFMRMGKAGRLFHILLRCSYSTETDILSYARIQEHDVLINHPNPIAPLLLIESR